MLVRLTIIICLLSVCCAAYSASTFPVREARLSLVSPTGRTAIINLGSLEGIKEQDYAVLVKKIKNENDSTLRLVPVAKARIIKTDTNRSYIIMFKTFEHLPQTGDVVLVLTEADLLAGREKLVVSQNKIISSPGKIAQSLSDQETREKDSMAQKAQNYRMLHKNHDIDQKFNDTFVVTDVDKWKVIADESPKTLKPSAIYRSEYKDDFIQKKRLETFEKLVVNFLQKYNRPGFNYADFYYEQMRDPTFHEFREGLNYQSEYLAFLERESKRNSKDAYLYRQLLEKGQAWSEDFSDSELEQLLSRVGVVYEQERRRVIMSNRYKLQAHVNAGFNFLDNENRLDNENARKAKWHSEFGLRVFPFNQVENLNQVAFEGQLKYAIDGISLGIYNAQSTEVAAYAYVVYYPFASPYVVDKNSFYVAVGGKSGINNLNVPSLGESSNYNSFALPVFQTGLIYNFISGYGLRISFTFERSSLTKTGASSAASVLPEQTTFQEGRLGIGLTKFF